jgi:intein/homing endonuclease
MRHNSSPFDCNDAAYSEANSCYSYSQGTYYGYSQGYYYSYSQGYYYGYSQGTYYGYSQSWYGVCFPAGTKILMADGSTKEIQDISSGDEVLSYDLDQKRTVKDKVSKLLVHANAPGGYLIFNGELKVTGNHNMWVENKGIWLHADKLMVGDVLLNSKGEKVPVASIEKVDGVNTVYNLGLPGENHNYFTEDILVHNWKG